MRYCINCGSQMGNERFCNQCGTDNGKQKVPDLEKQGFTFDAAKFDLSFILHIVSLGLIVIAAIVLLAACCKQAEYITATSMLYTGGSVFAAIYFVLGMWSCIPAMLLLLNVKRKNTASLLGMIIAMVVIMISICIINAIFIKSAGSMRILGVIAAPYKVKAVSVITLSVISGIVGITGQAISK